jgi:hypothetical protein
MAAHPEAPQQTGLLSMHHSKKLIEPASNTELRASEINDSR